MKKYYSMSPIFNWGKTQLFKKIKIEKNEKNTNYTTFN